MKTKNLLNVPAPWPKQRRSFNANLIPNKLAELARAGVYYDSYVRSNEEVDSRATPFARGVPPVARVAGSLVNPTWEEQITDGEEDVELIGVQGAIRRSL